jgi:hypothetical protein
MLDISYDSLYQLYFKIYLYDIAVWRVSAEYAGEFKVLADFAPSEYSVLQK